MSQLCQSCGNQIVVGPGPICLVCQHTGRGHERTATEIMMARNHATALDAVYRVMDQGVIQTEEQQEQEAIVTVEEARMSLSARIKDQQHSRETPDWRLIDEEQAEEDRERNTCGLCCGTGLIMGKHCPECWSED